MRIIDRENERRDLLELASREEPTMALLYGRRRVGKSYLLTHMWGEEQDLFYFTASAITPEQNRRQLVRSASEWAGTEFPPEDYPSWRTVFRLLFSLAGERSFVIVLDEFQYFGQDEKELAAVTSELNAVWEGPERPRGPLLLVLSGSAMGVMRTLDSGGSPLYGRLAWKSKLEPFDYYDSGEMVPYEAFRDRAYTYGIFGGMPRYLAPVDVEKTVAQNATRLLLAPSGEVRAQVETTLMQEQGLRDVNTYMGILRAIASGRCDLSEIADRAGIDGGTSTRDKIERLVELGHVQKRRNFDAGKTAAYRYFLCDPALRFYYEFVTRFEAALEVTPADEIWSERVEPEIDRYMGHLFESIVEEAYYRGRAARGMPIVSEWSRWEGVDRNRESLEMDIVARCADGRMLTGAVKWSNKPVSLKLHRDHVRDLQRLAMSGQKWAHEALDTGMLLYVNAGGFQDGFETSISSEGASVQVWTLEDLYSF